MVQPCGICDFTSRAIWRCAAQQHYRPSNAWVRYGIDEGRSAERVANVGISSASDECLQHTQLLIHRYLGHFPHIWPGYRSRRDAADNHDRPVSLLRRGEMISAVDRWMGKSLALILALTLPCSYATPRQQEEYTFHVQAEL